jgi:DNA-binding IclR family transcriptional regulator
MLKGASLDAMLERNRTLKSMSKARRQAVKAELGRIRDSGYCVAPSAYRTGIDVSCAVGSAAIGVTAALGVPFVSGGMNHGKERKLISVIQKFAKRITRRMGLPSEPFRSSPLATSN